MAAGTLLSRITGLMRVLALLYAIGGGTLAGAYNLANTVPNIIYDLVAGGVLSATLIPVFVAELQTRERDDAWDGLSAVISIAAVLLVAASLLVVFVAPYVMDGYTAAAPASYRAGEQRVATVLLRLFAPQILLYGLITIVTAVLNARRRFAAPMFVPIVNNLLVIAVLLIAGTMVRNGNVNGAVHDRTLLDVLGIGTTAGVAAQAAALLPALRGTGARLRWRWDPSHPAVRAVLRLSSWTMGIVLTNQVALFVVLLLANGQANGATAYTVAYTFFQMPYAVIAVSIMSARQPGWASAWAAGNSAALRREVSSALRSLFALILPITVVVTVVADPLIRVLGQHGATTAGESATTGNVLAILALGLPGFCTYLLYIRVYQAMQDTRTAFLLYLVENGINVVLAAALFRPWGVQGVAASVSVAYTIAAVVAGARLRGRLGTPARQMGRTPAFVARRSLALSVPAGALAWFAEHAVPAATLLGSLERLVLAGVVATATFWAGLKAVLRLSDPRRR